MKKADLVNVVAEKAALTKTQAQASVESLIAALADALAAGETIELRGFGSFGVRSSKERVGRNPKTGEAVKIPARKTPTFKAGKDLKTQVNEKSL